MFTIIKGQKKIQIPSTDLASLQPASDGIIIRCTDNTEIRFYCELSGSLKACLAVADKNLNKEITIDLNAAARGDNNNIMKVGVTFEGNPGKIKTPANVQK